MLTDTPNLFYLTVQDSHDSLITIPYMKPDITAKQLGVEYTINFDYKITPSFTLMQGVRKGEVVHSGEKIN